MCVLVVVHTHMYGCTHVVRYVIVCTGLCVLVIVHTHMYGCTHVVRYVTMCTGYVCGGYCLQLRLFVYRAGLSDTMRNQDKKVCSCVFVCIRMCSGMCACIHVHSLVRMYMYVMHMPWSDVCHMYVTCMSHVCTHSPSVWSLLCTCSCTYLCCVTVLCECSVHVRTCF